MFIGKTNEELPPLLQENYLIRCLDLAVMPDLAFGYYGIGFANFILAANLDDERFGVFLGAFLDATSRKRESSPLCWLGFWRHADGLLERLFKKLGACEMNEDTKNELTKELDELRSAISE